jgi:phosphatidyl-myo-inositol dimannoside synthase
MHMDRHVLLVTDHAFYEKEGRLFDNYCFDEAFFADYVKVFGSVRLACRVAPGLPPEGAFPAGGPAVRWEALPNLRGGRWMLWAALKGRGRMKSLVGKASCVVVRVPGELGWWASLAARQAATPLMMEVVGEPRSGLQTTRTGPVASVIGALQARRLRRLSRWVDAASYVNRTELPGLYPCRADVPWEAISSVRLDRAQLRPPRQAPREAGRIRVAFVGTFTRRKRVADIVLACGALRAQGLAVSAVLVGDGPDRPSVEDAVRQHELSAAIRLPGHIADRGTLWALLDESDVFVMPSASEGLPRAVLEAMARGLPAIGSHIPGHAEVLAPEAMFPVGNHAALAAILGRLGTDPTLYLRLSERSATTVAGFLDETLSPRRRRLYEHLLSLARGEGVRHPGRRRSQ